LAGRSVVIVDDVLATGGTVAAAHRLLEHAGAQVATAAVVVELIGLGGRERVAPLPVYSLRRM
jgi:adenine phosphoribosyltransferase